MILPTKLIKTEWPNEGLRPGNERFDTVLESVRKIGIQEPITINLEWRVIQGNHRLAVARHLGMKEIEVQVWTGTGTVI